MRRPSSALLSSMAHPATLLVPMGTTPLHLNPGVSLGRMLVFSRSLTLLSKLLLSLSTVVSMQCQGLATIERERSDLHSTIAMLLLETLHPCVCLSLMLVGGERI